MKSLVFTKYFSSTASKEEETWNNNNNKLFIRTYQYGLIEHISYKS